MVKGSFEKIREWQNEVFDEKKYQDGLLYIPKLDALRFF